MRHLFIPDTQVKPGVPTDHIEALGNYIAVKRPEKIIVAGDWWDMQATSNHNSAQEQEGLRVIDDIDCGKAAMHRLHRPIAKQNRVYLKRKVKQYRPEKWFLYGNHEHHLQRIWESDPRLQGLIDYSALELHRWGFKEVPYNGSTPGQVRIDNILYAHYFANPMSSRPYGGMIETRIKNIGSSFTQGHAQSFKYGELEFAGGVRRHGCVAGAFYMHDEGYKGEGNHHWRGVVMKNEVDDGEYDIMKVSLNYLLRKYL